MSESSAFFEKEFPVIAYLKTRKGVTDIKLENRRGASLVDIQAWEERNRPFTLPKDFKSFLLLSDGLLLRWSMNYNGEEIPLGCMSLNPLDKVVKLPFTRFELVDSKDSLAEESSDEEAEDEDGGEKEGSGDEASGVEEADGAKAGGGDKKQSSSRRRRVTAFDINSLCRGGRLAFVYEDSTSDPEVWFQALSCRWFRIATTFSNYFRLMMVHLGLPHWQYAFTESGLDPVSRQWLRLLCPQRLGIDFFGSKGLSNDADDAMSGFNFEDSSSRRRGKSQGKHSLTVFKINLKKLDKYARMQLKSKARRIRKGLAT